MRYMSIRLRDMSQTKLSYNSATAQENEMKYNVLIADQETRARLEELFPGRVGSGVVSNVVIVDTPYYSNFEITNVEGVLSVEPDTEAQPLEWPVTVPEPFKNRAWQIDPLQALEFISSVSGRYANTRDGEGVDCYVIDSPVDVAHEEFEGRASVLWNDANANHASDHGTAVASCVGGKLCGTAKRVTILGVGVDMWVSSIIKALDIVLKHHLSKPDDRPSVVNISLSANSMVLGEVVSALAKRGVIIVAAAGNYAEDKPTIPARNFDVIEVGALNEHGTAPADFSNRGARFWAIGEYVHVAKLGGGYTYMSGTSFASPHVAGIVACQQQFSSKMNQAGGDYAFYLQSLCDNDRIAWFPNGGATAHTVTTDQPNGGIYPYYVAPSLRFTDADITEFCRQYELQPSVIAQEAFSQNVGPNRFERVALEHFSTHLTLPVINEWAAQNGTKFWWVA
jgi:subtilisin family serine protease